MMTDEERREYDHKYYVEHKAQRMEHDRKYRETHREYLREYNRRYREKNRDKINARRRERFAAMSEEQREKWRMRNIVCSRNYYAEHRDEILAKQRAKRNGTYFEAPKEYLLISPAPEGCIYPDCFHCPLEDCMREDEA